MYIQLSCKLDINRPIATNKKAIQLSLQEVQASMNSVICCMFPTIVRPNNMIVQSPPGTGKTAAFVLSMLSRVDATQNFTQVRFEM